MRPQVLLLLLLSARPSAASVIGELARSARGHALADGGALLNGIHALGENPGALATESAELLSQYQRLPLDTFFSMLAYAQPLGGSGATLAPSYATLQSRSLERRDSEGRRGGEFAHEEHLIGLHGALSSGALSLGAGARRLETRVGTFRSSAYGIDLGVRYRVTESRLTLGLSGMNLGSGPEPGSALTRRLVAAAGADLAGPLSVALAYGYEPLARRGDVSLGTELRLGAVFALRAHYTVAAGSEGGAQRAAGSLGFNPMPDLSLDYGFDPFPAPVRAAGETGAHRLTIAYRFAAREPSAPRGRQRSYWDHYWRTGER